MSDKALAIRPVVTPTVWDTVRAIAPAMHQSRLFGVTSPDQAAAIMLKGYELGLTFTASFEFVQVVQGKVALSPRGMLALIHQSNAAAVTITRLEKDGKFLGYECHMKRRDNGFEHTSRFTLEDAKRAGLVKPDGAWEHYPENMCLWRSVGFCADVVVPDIGGGMRRADEFGAAVSLNGDVIEADYSVVATTTLESLIAEFGAAAVLEANNGQIPTTPEELENVWKLLDEVGA